MAYWGAAIAAFNDRKRAQGFIAKAVELKSQSTEREKMYIDAAEAYFKGETDEKKIKEDEKKEKAADYLKALESIVLKFPEDLEAKAFVAHRIWYNGREGIPVSSYLAADALINEIYAEEPLHPAHHYTIHLWDYRKPEKALASAARCGIAAPGIAHMWHMPGHIYSRLKRYEDAVYQQEASARVDHAHMIRDRVIPDEISNYAHNNEWLIRNLVFIGRLHDAVDLALNMNSLPRHPRYNTLDKAQGSASYGRRRLLQVLREYQLYDDVIKLYASGDLRVSEESDVDEQVKSLRLLACSAAITNRPEIATQPEQRIREILATNQPQLKPLGTKKRHLKAAVTARDAQEDDAPPRPVADFIDPDSLDDDLEATSKELATAKRLVSQCEKALLAIEGYRLVAEMEYGAARQKLKEATGEDISWLAELHFLAGDVTESKKTAQKQIKRRPKEVIPLARFAYLEYLNYLQNGKLETEEDPEVASLEDVRTAMGNLREASSSFDLDVPLFARLKPAAELLGYDDDWRLPRTVANDLGFRPALDSLGPFRWSPSPAPQWSLVDVNDSQIGSQDFLGKPHIIIFYLGHGCLHCAEQLEAFGPKLGDFEAAGIEFVAISSDDREGLAKSVEQYNGDMPFKQLISDERLEVFKSFRAYDDFEQQPLHGTFLIDSRGFVRWQDIGYQPFMDHEFLLDEAKRLLKQSEPLKEVTGHASK